MKITHQGIDYAILSVGGNDYEISLALAKAIKKELKG